MYIYIYYLYIIYNIYIYIICIYSISIVYVYVVHHGISSPTPSLGAQLSWSAQGNRDDGTILVSTSKHGGSCSTTVKWLTNVVGYQFQPPFSTWFTIS